MPEPSQIEDCEACGEEIAEGDATECPMCDRTVHTNCVCVCDCGCGAIGCGKCFIGDDGCYWFAAEECKVEWEAEE